MYNIIIFYVDTEINTKLENRHVKHFTLFGSVEDEASSFAFSFWRFQNVKRFENYYNKFFSN